MAPLLCVGWGAGWCGGRGRGAAIFQRQFGFIGEYFIHFYFFKILFLYLYCFSVLFFERFFSFVLMSFRTCFSFMLSFDLFRRSAYCGILYAYFSCPVFFCPEVLFLFVWSSLEIIGVVFHLFLAIQFLSSFGSICFIWNSSRSIGIVHFCFSKI